MAHKGSVVDGHIDHHVLAHGPTHNFSVVLQHIVPVLIPYLVKVRTRTVRVHLCRSAETPVSIPIENVGVGEMSNSVQTSSQ